MKKLSLDEYRKIELEVLIKIDKICRDNNIKYFLYAGTLLGAIRHKGFIPWDDDIDICLLREDYNKLAKIIQSGNYGINFIRIEENNDTIYPYGKVCDTTTIIEEKNFKQVKNYGVFVDVFPFDYLPDDKKEQEMIKKKYLRRMRAITHASRTGYEKTNSIKTNIQRAAAFNILKFKNSSKMVKKFNNDLVKLNREKSNYVGIAWVKALPAEEYLESSEVLFEGRKFMAPKNPKRILKILFGDYEKLPPKNDRILKHTLKCYKK